MSVNPVQPATSQSNPAPAVKSNGSSRDYQALMGKAVLELRELKGKLNALEAAKQEPLALIGMGCRFPGGIDSPATFWAALGAGQDLITEIPANRWDIHHYYDADPAARGKMYIRHGGFLEQIETFDPHFFGLSPREALKLDPQQRLLLETSWEALENAGIAADQLAGSQTGVFVGICGTDYFQRLLAQGEEEIDAYVASGIAHSTASGRLSFLLGLQGPNLAVDTACSSSLVAVHLACQSLRNAECNLALVGGVNLLLSPEISINHSRARMLAPDGRCKAFDAAANGFIRSEGCGVVVLKRLSDAQAAGDPIWAVIRGSAVNQDGRTSGLTVPNGLSQQSVIRQALANSGVEAAQVRYVEAHGTGTALGDPIEVEALGALFGKVRSPEEPLIIGSVKTNFGHAEAAAGIAGLIKTALVLYHQEIPRHLHFHNPNPHIDWAHLPIHVPTVAQPWPVAEDAGAAGVAGVSSFGFSGTNAHVVLAAAPQPVAPVSTTADEPAERPWHLLTLTAKSEEALRALAQRYAATIAAHPDLVLADLCYTAATGRAHFSQRLSVPAATREQLRQTLAAFATGQTPTGLSHGVAPQRRAPKVAFLFTGQGAQYVNMGRELYESQPTFRATLDRCDALLREHLGESILAVIFGDQLAKGQDDKMSESSGHPVILSQTGYTQPTLFALEYALAELWQSWGIQPSVVMGHSVGEIAAACVADVFSLADGLKLIAARGRLMQALPQNGAMVAITTAADSTSSSTASSLETQITELIVPYADRVSIAALNSPHNIVIAGHQAAIDQVIAKFQAAKTCPEQSRRVVNLPVSHAFHSPLMEPMLAGFAAVARTITYHRPQVTFVSNLTGQVVTDEVTNPDYWVRHVRETVRFAAGVKTLQQQGIDAVIEIGPKPTLLGMGDWRLETGGSVTEWKSPITNHQSPITKLPSLRPNHSDWQQMLTSLGQIFVQGATIDWAGFEQGYPARRKVMLPTYPFQRQRYWVENPPKRAGGNRENVATSPVVDLLNRGNVQQLARYLQPDGAVTAEQLTLLTELIKHHQADLVQPVDQDLFYTLVWRPRALPEPQQPKPTAGGWLILADASGVGRRLANRLRMQGITALEAYTGATTTVDCAGVSTLNPAEPTAFADLLTQVAAAQIEVQHIVYLWGVDDDGQPLMTDATLMAAQTRNGGALLHLLQTLAEHDTREITVWTVTQGAVALSETDAPLTATGLAQAPLWGLGRAAALEQPTHWGGLIDLPNQPTAQDLDTLLALVNDAVGEDQIVVRAGKTWVARLVRTAQAAPSTLTCTADGTYWITGGLGALGLQTAQWLVQQGARHLVLTGRRGVATPAAQAGIAALEEAGAQVVVFAADVAVEDDVQRVLAQIKATLPPLRGIIHAAGLTGYQSLATLNVGTLTDLLRPKVQGAWLLHQLTQDVPLDFFVLYSSIAAVWGSKGQLHYGAANAFLDALAHSRRGAGLPALSVNWGPWQGGGMASDAALAQLRQMGVEGIPPAVALAALGTLLNAASTQTTVARMDWARFKPLYAAARTRRLFAELDEPHRASSATSTLAAEPATPTLVQTLAAAPVQSRFNRLTEHLQHEVAAILSWNEAQLPDPEAGFTELGMDSLMAVELRQRLATTLAADLPTTLVFEHPTIRQLSAHLGQHVLGWTANGAHEVAMTTDAAMATTMDAAVDSTAIAELSAAEFEDAVAQELAELQALLEAS
ncbi:MAG: type I polyketide synthase [Caldilineaceae bacterium]